MAENDDKFFGDIDNPRSPFERFFFAVYKVIDGPVVWFRENIVESSRPKYYYYHQKFRRVPGIDECYERDTLCFYEANEQYKRDKLVDSQILTILRQRRQDCTLYERPDHMVKCKKIYDDYKEAETNWFIKYGDLGARGNVKDAYMKQKHRLVWERRYGSNREAREEPADSEEMIN